MVKLDEYIAILVENKNNFSTFSSPPLVIIYGTPTIYSIEA